MAEQELNEGIDSHEAYQDNQREAAENYGKLRGLRQVPGVLPVRLQDFRNCGKSIL